MDTRIAHLEESLHHLDLEHDLRLEFDLARRELAHALRAQRRKDTQAARQLVVEHRARVDAVLDLWNGTAQPSC